MRKVSKRDLEVRWRNAVEKALVIKARIDEGNIVLMPNGEIVHGITITDTQILLILSPRVTSPLAHKSEYGYTMGQTIADFNAQFYRWHYYKPETGGRLFTDKELK